MAWRLPNHVHRTYARNPLEAVIVQLRFDPILKIGDRVADFQDGIRGRFPKFEVQETQSFEISPVSGVRTRNEQEYRFRAKDGSGTVFLNTHAVAMETRAHIERDALLSNFEMVLSSLRSVFDPVSPLRLGLRYLNVLDRQQIGADLGRDVGWEELVAEDFVRIPCDLAGLEGMAVGSECAGSIDGGRMTLRYGLVPEGTDKERFRLDIDRFQEDGVEMDHVKSLLTGYASDIYSVFKTAARSGLIEWMEKEA